MAKKRRKLSDWHLNYGVNPRKQMLVYRNGKKKAVSLSPIFREKERGQIVDSAMDALRDWRLSPFENEGPIWAGIRSSLCLAGYSWVRSDFEAGLIVATGLARMGAQRPSWEQGQLEYTIPNENCARCAGPRDIAIRGRFCSVECAKAFAVERQAYEIRRDTAVYRSAVRILRQERKDRRQCLHCGGSFMHDGEKDPRQFCSQDCYFRHRRTEAFTKFPNVCKFCEKPFMGRRNGAFYCSNSCQLTESKLRLGKRLPKRLTRPIFDYVFRQAA